MESEESLLRLETCENCYQHEKMDNHPQAPFVQALNQLKALCDALSIKLKKNQPPKYLVKASDTKFSSRRYLDTNIGKIQEFPRRGSFEIFYLNILIFSKLKNGNFPESEFLNEVITTVRAIHKEDPTLKGFARFRNLQYEFRRNSSDLEPLYDYLKLFCPSNCQKKQLKIILKKIRKEDRQYSSQQAIYPYSVYGQKEKQGKMQNIYCPSSMKVLDFSKSKVKASSKVMMYIRGKSQASDLFTKKSSINSNHKFEMEIAKTHKRINPKNLRLASEALGHNRKQKIQEADQISSQKMKRPQTTHRRLQSIKPHPPKSILKRSETARNPIINKNSQKTKDKAQKIDGHKKNASSQKFKSLQNKVRNIQTSQQSRLARVETAKKGKSLSRQKQISQKNKVVSPIEKTQSQYLKNSKSPRERAIVSPKQNEAQKLEKSRKITIQRIEKSENEQSVYYEAAAICKKFSQQKNFERTIFDEEENQELTQLSKFKVQCIETLKKFSVKTIRQLYKVKKLTLFPNQNKEIKNYPTKLAQLTNFLLNENQFTLIRLFQNKKYVNPSGIYCVWLRQLSGYLAPVYVNDQFAFDLQGSPIYAKMGAENSIWFMILEKAVAKVLGGYHLLHQATISTLMRILLGCPIVDFDCMSSIKLYKTLQQKVFKNKIGSLIAYHEREEALVKIIDYEKNPADFNESSLQLQTKSSSFSMTLKEFQAISRNVTLVFFSNHYFVNQVSLHLPNKNNVLSCRIISNSQKSICYFVFSGFPASKPTKATIYRKLDKQEENTMQMHNPLKEEKVRYEYVGQITKIQSFFFETQLFAGEYLCVMESSYKRGCQPKFLLYSEEAVQVFGNDARDPFGNKIINPKKVKKGEQIDKRESTLISKTNISSRALANKSMASINSKVSPKAFRINKQFLVEGDSDSSQKENQQIIL